MRVRAYQDDIHTTPVSTMSRHLSIQNLHTHQYNIHTLTMSAPFYVGGFPLGPWACVDSTGAAVQQLLIHHQWGIQGDCRLTEQYKKLVQWLLGGWDVCVCVICVIWVICVCPTMHTSNANCSMRRVASTRSVPPQLVSMRSASSSLPSSLVGSTSCRGGMCITSENKN